MTSLPEQIARHHFQRPEAPCPWEAVDPLTQAGIIRAAATWLEDAIPVLTANGWTPPTDQETKQ